MAQLVFFGLIGTTITILVGVLNFQYTAAERHSQQGPLATVSWNG